MTKEEKNSEKNKERHNKEAIKKLRERLQKCEKERVDFLTGWQRTKADYLNARKDEIEKIKTIIKGANEELVLKILPVLDNLELAEKNLPKDLKEEDFTKGIVQIKKQFLDILKQEGVEEIKAMGEKFDPNFHDVIEEIEKKDISSGIIIEEIKKGYTLNGRVIRPSKVRVAR